MKKITYTILMLSIGFLYPKYTFSQWDEKSVEIRFSIPEVALIDIEPSFDNSIRFNVSSTTESGSSPIVEKDSENTLWINYTSSNSDLGTKRKITVEVSSGEIPAGLLLYLEVSQYIGSGKGKRGNPAGKILLTNAPKTLINNVGNCFTGDGVGNGHQLNYSLDISDYSKINSASEIAFTILYTLTDN